MSNKKLFLIWGIFFILCAGLGFIPEPEGLLKALMVLLALDFFAPGVLLLYYAIKGRDRATLRRLRNLSAASLALTLVLLVANFLSVMAPQPAGDLLYGLLVIFSAPMICGQFWAVSMFLWACLLMVSLTWLRRFKN